jgi:hypothetical protein
LFPRGRPFAKEGGTALAVDYHPVGSAASAASLALRSDLHPLEHPEWIAAKQEKKLTMCSGDFRVALIVQLVEYCHTSR